MRFRIQVNVARTAQDGSLDNLFEQPQRSAGDVGAGLRIVASNERGDRLRVLGPQHPDWHPNSDFQLGDGQRIVLVRQDDLQPVAVDGKRQHTPAARLLARDLANRLRRRDDPLQVDVGMPRRAAAGTS